VRVDELPRSALLARQPLALQRLCTLTGGDDYELIFSAPVQARAAVQAAAAASATPVMRVGQLDAAPGLRLLDRGGQLLREDLASFDHFKSS
jgi:thiamine-monophosphate kinase